ncbi:MAG: glycosyltransferase family 9 protein [Campylobacterota bacterium]
MNKIFIEIPTWLGDAVMATPAIENIVKTYPDAQIVLFGSFVATQALQKHPNVSEVVVDESKKSSCRLCALYKSAKKLGRFDLAVSFRRTMSAKFLLFALSADRKAAYTRTTAKTQHLVMHYNDFVNKLFNTAHQPGPLRLYQKPKTLAKKTLGLNPGATYGSAKRWYPGRFAAVAAQLSKDYTVVIFGGPGEIKPADDIQKALKDLGVTDVINLAGKTSVQELIEYIGGLDLFVTNDSGPMHVAAAYQVPTAAIFGPTKYSETSQWHNAKSAVVTKDLKCAPCMKRVCPLKTHECMQAVQAKDVTAAIRNL